MFGLSKDSITKEIINKVDSSTAIKYSIKEELIDLEALRQEKEGIEQMLATPEPTDKELIELGKANHPYFMDKASLEARLAEIKSILGK